MFPFRPARFHPNQAAAFLGAASLLIPCASAAARAASTDSNRRAIESRVADLQLAAQRSFAQRDWDGAERIIRQIAAIDPDHPKAYLLVVLMEHRRRTLAETDGELERLGLGSVAGRSYARGVADVMERHDEDAREALGRALAAYEHLAHPAGLAACHTALGNLDRRAGKLDAAGAEYEAAGRQLDAIGDQAGLADILSALAKLERSTGHPADAAASQRRVLAIRKALGDEDGQARSLHEIGVCLMEAGDLAGARSALDEALDIRRQRADRPATISTLRVIAQVEADSGGTPSALASLREARDLARSGGDARQEAEILVQAGEIDLNADRNQKALESCEASSAGFASLRDAARKAAADLCAGSALDGLGEFRRAEARIEQVLSAARARSNKPLEASALTELTATALHTGDLLSALDNAEKALDLHTELRNVRGQRADQNNLGIVYHDLGEAARATRAMRDALKLAEATGDPADQIAAKVNLGVLLAEQGKEEEGLGYLESAAKAASAGAGPRLRAAAWADIAEVEARRERLPEASRKLDAALDLLRSVGDSAALASILNQKGGVLRLQGRWKEARQVYEQALDLAGKYGLPEEAWRAHWGLAATLGSLGRSGEAIREGMKAIDGVEQARARLDTGALRMRYLADRIGPYETEMELLLDGTHAPSASRISEAFDVAERSRARSLLDQLAEAEARRRAHIDPSLRRSESEALDRISEAEVRLASGDEEVDRSSARKQIDAGEEDLRRIDGRIRAASAGAGLDPPPASAGEVQDVLEKGEVLLDYFLGERAGWLWILTRDALQVRRLPPASALQAEVAAWRSALAAPGRAFDTKPATAGAELARKILPPGALPPGARLLIVPDGPLHDLPFDALPVDGKPLVETRETAVLPSASVLRALRGSRRAARASAFLGVGPPPASAAAGSPLPAANREVARIAEMFPEGDRTVLPGAGASRDALFGMDLSRYRFVHFATHGWIDHADPRHSGLRLGGESGAPSLLSVSDIPGLKLAAEVVVLSACDTAGGETLRGEGVEGLAHAFLRAGAGSVVVSLWNVDDEATADFMETFYRKMLAGAQAGAALRQAKLAFLRSDSPARREAFRWAPFVLVGAPEAGAR